MEHINYTKLRQDLLGKAGPSDNMTAIIEIENAPREKLIKLAYEYGLNIIEYIES